MGDRKRGLHTDGLDTTICSREYPSGVILGGCDWTKNANVRGTCAFKYQGTHGPRWSVVKRRNDAASLQVHDLNLTRVVAKNRQSEQSHYTMRLYGRLCQHGISSAKSLHGPSPRANYILVHSIWSVRWYVPRHFKNCGGLEIKFPSFLLKATNALHTWA